MPIDPLSLFIGFVTGAVVVAIAWNLSSRTSKPTESTRLSGTWSLDDVASPGTRLAVLATRIAEIRLPSNAKVLVPRAESVTPEVLATCEVRMHPEVRVNAAIGKDRALVFSGAVHPKTTAMTTLETNAVRRLQGDFQRLWSESTPYVEPVASVSGLSGKAGRMVEVTGQAADVLEFRGRKMLRISDGKAAVGVVTSQGDVAQWSGATIRVSGRLLREGGYTYIDATAVTPVGQAAAPMA
ncbi:MAG: hypothetical protein QOE90_553 [Thermoplasmata archaeon]|jgi:hypothetical protein|nr:hypothetical protein [Thermoplasmata archaeon]